LERQRQRRRDRQLMNRTSHPIPIAIVLGFLLAPSSILAQTQPTPPAPPAPAKTPDPTLDDLLGLPRNTSPKPPAPKPDATDKPAPDKPADSGNLDPAKTELDRMLSPK